VKSNVISIDYCSNNILLMFNNIEQAINAMTEEYNTYSEYEKAKLTTYLDNFNKYPHVKKIIKELNKKNKKEVKEETK